MMEQGNGMIKEREKSWSETRKERQAGTNTLKNKKTSQLRFINH
jgi:hypothetical protein